MFVRVAETGSLSRAGRELMLSQPSVSRVVGALEARLGTTLLLRTTRSISLTVLGEAARERKGSSPYGPAAPRPHLPRRRGLPPPARRPEGDRRSPR
ncbi:LysR family transcriptional regulator [Methylobacterium sp. 37f]|uniref:helix-turn-helix domain-containing protein n=1 Tax=Methylobacterium sp. 37f TaxID=2817058 RepID=UPI0032B626EE